MNIQHLPQSPLGRQFDGLFNKFTLNAFWGDRLQGGQGRLIDAMLAQMTPQGWGWKGPWNGAPKTPPMSAADQKRLLDERRALFEGHGIKTCPLSGLQARRYGVHGEVANSVVYIMNLVWRP